MNQRILLSSIITLLLTSGVHAEKLSDATLDALSAEASQTNMKEKPPTTAAEAEPAVVPSEDTDIDDLSKSVAKQLSGILGTAEMDSEEETEEKLEKVVSSALIGGVKMNDLRSAVSAAMADIGSAESGEHSPETVQKASKSLEKLVGKKENSTQNSSEGYIQSLKQEAKEFSSTSSDQEVASKRPVKSAPAPVESPEAETSVENEQAETITVIAGESLYKIALRVYGSGENYLRLYEANKDTIADPNVIRVGQVLRIPR